MPSHYTIGGLSTELKKPRNVVSAALHIAPTLAGNEHLQADKIDFDAKTVMVPQAHLAPLRNFFENYAQITALCKEHGISSAGRKEMMDRAKKGDLKEHAIIQSKIIFLKREAMKFVNEPKKKAKRTDPILEKLSTRSAMPPSYFQRAGAQVHMGRLISAANKKLANRNFVESRQAIPGLIEESGGQTTFFANALQTAVRKCNAIELHNLVTRIGQLAPQLRRALLETYLEKRKAFAPRRGVLNDDALRQSTDEVYEKYGG